MRKIILPKKDSEIQLDELTKTDQILVYVDGEPSGTVIYNSGGWISTFNNPNQKKHDSVEGAINWFGADCEFYVL